MLRQCQSLHALYLLQHHSKLRTTTNKPSTGPSRCFPFWQEVLACYVTNTNSEDDSGKVKCQPVLEDYYECLHHKKEVRFISALDALPLRLEHLGDQHHHQHLHFIRKR